jgi:hypothetical protein
MLDAGYWMLDAGYRIQDLQCLPTQTLNPIPCNHFQSKIRIPTSHFRIPTSR